jgi:hypothetical protein
MQAMLTTILTVVAMLVAVEAGIIKLFAQNPGALPQMIGDPVRRPFSLSIGHHTPLA